MKCPDCQQYSLTYDFLRNGWVCHVYNGFIPDERMQNNLSAKLHALEQLVYARTVSVRRARKMLGMA